ncbi:hypothetical protein LTR70_004625 [Exophiala xenobiotica]|uniref:Uncharacterized protein n=1 Tax=Lithohypha guttulata TaxID=1690604 RepID=A0ABR0KCQ1_9EURO|nr:hypothetical protein LTR24_004118 [Lithohypha guttulata]KAK5320398.1 hypothetical protein LTR70_004625 [Exophiala xenobiotica]
MPLDHKSRSTTKPLMPALSSNLRPRPAHGFTPRLAATTPTSPASAPQRTLRQQTLSPDRADEARTTLSLNSNITPRSGARNIRFDTESPSTPDTPARSKAVTVGDQPDAQAENYGPGIRSPATPTYSRSNSTDQPSLLPTAGSRRISAGSSASSTKDESKFFRANDVKPSSAPFKNGCTRPKTTYNARAPSPRVSPKKPPAGNAQRLDERSFYSRNAANQQGPRVPKPSLTQKLSYASNTAASAHSTVSVPSARQRASSNAHSAVSSSLDRRRSSSLNIKPAVVDTKAHRKSLSTSSSTISPISTRSPIVIQVPEDRLPQANADRTCHALDTAAAISPSSSSPRSASLGSTNTAATSAASETAKLDIQVPIKPQLHTRHTRGSSETTAIQPVTKEQLDAATNARRERKVLDLEISNSSLLAVNKTLEKELRKQNAELRRFRRLSRSGRLSFTPSNRIVSGASTATLATLQEADHDDMPSPASPNSSDPGSLYDEGDFSDDGSSSFTESSDKMRRRARDEKRLMQDLQRHQQILIDSQKLTQSIQRCLNCTDELIKDGQKALAYQVEGRGVKVGGRVLNPDDDEALSEVDCNDFREGLLKSESRQGLLSPSITRTELEEAAMWVNGLQSLDGQNETVHGIERILPEKTTRESPSSTLDMSPAILPER